MPRHRFWLFIISYNGVPGSDSVFIDRQFILCLRRAKIDFYIVRRVCPLNVDARHTEHILVAGPLLISDAGKAVVLGFHVGGNRKGSGTENGR
jgi:hypothetical protein